MRPSMPSTRRGGLWSRAFFVLGFVLVLALLRGDTVVTKDRFGYDLGALSSQYAFDFLGWEIGSLASKVKTRVLDGDYASLTDDQRKQTVAEYFSTADRISQLTDETTRIHADPAAAQPDRTDALKTELSSARSRLAELAPATETILQGQIATILAEEGIGANPFGIFPPVSVRFERPPLILVVSPRNKIEIKTGAQLRPDLELDTIETLEADVDRLGVSSLVVTIGGISTYPAMIMQTGYRDWAVQTVAHEWLHDYLFLRPLGWSYGQSHEAIAINETVADIASQEIGDKALNRFYGVPIPDRTRREAEPASKDPEPAGFSFNREMRATRLAADALLAQGKVEEAEQYLEERRRVFLDNGYVIRKLNQAYFAFYGSYADGPISVDPIGRDLRTLRQRTANLSEFMDITSRLTTYEELKALLR